MAEESRLYCVNRTVCDILDDMRKAYEVRNFSYLLGLMEELQHRANRMEAGLQDCKDLMELAQERSKLKAEVFSLREEAAKQRLLKFSPNGENIDNSENVVKTNDEWIAENLDKWEKKGIEEDNLWDDDWESVMKDNPQ